MDELISAINNADIRRNDNMCYWVELHGDESGSCFCEFRGEIFTFSTIKEAIDKVNELAIISDGSK